MSFNHIIGPTQTFHLKIKVTLIPQHCLYLYSMRRHLFFPLHLFFRFVSLSFCCISVNLKDKSWIFLHAFQTNHFFLFHHTKFQNMVHPPYYSLSTLYIFSYFVFNLAHPPFHPPPPSCSRSFTTTPTSNTLKIELLHWYVK